MKSFKDIITSSLSLGTALTIASFWLAFGVANALSSTASTNVLSKIQSRAAGEITQRLATLSNLGSQVSLSSKLNSTDKALLSTEISSEVSGLTALKVQIAADTTTAQASTDEATIYTGYRVYAVVVPKVELLTISDNQQNNQTKLTALSQTLQTEINNDQAAGDNVSGVQTELTAMTTLISDAQGISSTIEADVSQVLPSTWNANHNIFSGDRNELTTAYHDNQTASYDSTIIAKALKSLKS